MGSTEAHQLLKIGYLVEHYIEHKNATNLSLIEFIDLHYIQPTVMDADYAEDMKLPFKSHSECHAQNSYLAKISNIDISIDVPYIQTTKQETQYLSPDIGSQYLNEIFQPPRFVTRHS